MSISTNAETVKVMDKASTDGSFTIAQTNGMDRRQDRRGDRQDCRQQEGASARTSATANSKDARPGVVKSTMSTPGRRMRFPAVPTAGAHFLWPERDRIGTQPPTRGERLVWLAPKGYAV